jgi:hypothetical protein
VIRPGFATLPKLSLKRPKKHSINKQYTNERLTVLLLDLSYRRLHLRRSKEQYFFTFIVIGHKINVF